MGLFDRFKKQPVVEEVEEVDEQEEVAVVSPEEFWVSESFGGIIYDFEPEGCLEFDLEHGCLRDAEHPNEIYSIGDVLGYHLIAGGFDGNSAYDIEDIANAYNVTILMVGLTMEYQFRKAPVAAIFYDCDMHGDSVVQSMNEAVEKAEAFMRFLRGLGISEG